jgi:hypothetical protein
MVIYHIFFGNLLKILSPVTKLHRVKFLKTTVLIFSVVTAQNLTNFFRLTKTKSRENEVIYVTIVPLTLMTVGRGDST